jgi:hypothetical protein
MALAWKAGWVYALTSSNLVSSATWLRETLLRNSPLGELSMCGLSSGLSWRSRAAFLGRERRAADVGERREIGPVDESGTPFESDAGNHG